MTTRSAPRVGLVLGGGGAKGSFQVGAVACLIREWGLRPDVLVGTSIGAIHATLLARGRDHAEQLALVDELLATWMSAREESDMFVARRWLDDVPGPARAGIGELARGRLSLRAVGAVVRAAPRVRRLPSHYRSDGSSLYSLAPLEARIREVIEAEPLRDRATPLRISAVALETGALRWVGEDGALYEADAVTPCGPRVPLVDGVLASAGFAPVFPPRRMAGATYVDGGFRTVVPARAALALGANVIVAVSCLQGRVVASPSLADADVVRLGLRVSGVLFTEVTERDVADLDRARSLLLEPSVEVHGLLTVEPGRVAISIDYGWLHAAETVEAVGGVDGLMSTTSPGRAPVRDVTALARSRGLTEAITRLRADTWSWEERLGATARDTDRAAALHEVRARKWLLRPALAARAERPGPVHETIRTWADGFERHRDALVLPDPWAGLSTVHGGPVAAVMPNRYAPPPFRLRGRESGREWLVADGRRQVTVDRAVPASARTIVVDDAIVELVPAA